MSIFKDIELTWRGDTYAIPGTSLLPLIARIEDEAATVFELCAMFAQNKPKATVIGKAIATTLRHLGAKAVDDEEIYDEATRDGKAREYLLALVQIVVPIRKSDDISKDDAQIEKKDLNTASSKDGISPP